MGKLDGKIAVVTGGNSGIGYATAERFVAEGATVVVTGRREAAVNEAVDKLSAGGGQVSGVVADQAVLEDSDRLVETIRERHGRIDVLFVNAGVAPMAPFAETSVDDFDRVFNINVRGLYFLLQKALPLLGQGASVIFNASVVHKYGFPGASAYSATKAAVRSIGQTVAAELAPTGVRVNLLSPGPVESPLWSKTGMEQEVVDGFGGAIGGRSPMGRFGRPDEMAAAALFLASDDSSYVTGSDLQADGGLTQAF